MSITLDLPEELESDLSAEAARLGLPLPEYVLRLLSLRGCWQTGRRPARR